MTTHPVMAALAAQGWLLADGATGTNLFNAGLEAGEAPEIWNRQARGKIAALYQGSVGAGADLFLTNSFGANRSRLKLHGAEDEAEDYARISAEIAREVADKAGRRVFVAGSVGPTGEILAPLGAMTEDEASEVFEEQITGLKAGGADIVWVETMSSFEEYRAAGAAAARVGIAWAGTMSFDTAGRTMMGVTSAQLAKAAEAMADAPLAIGANCGVGASDLLRTVLGIAATGTARPIIAKGNAGIPKFHDGHIHYDGTPDLMADYAVMARDCGAAIIGGCCGTTPAHLVKMRAALETRARGDAPALEEIAAKLGAFSSDSDGTGENAGPAPRAGRRRGRAAA